MRRALLLLLLAACASAQTPIVSGTLNTALTVSGVTVNLAASPGAVTNQYALIGVELMYVRAVQSANLTVTRGSSGTTPLAHARGANAWIGPLLAFVASNPTGACVRSSLPYVPVVSLSSGNAYDCIGSVYTLVAGSGVAFGVPIGGTGSTSFTGLGCVSVSADGLHLLTLSATPCGSGGGSSAWSSITSGTNNIATMFCGTGCAMTFSGSGSIVASHISSLTGVVKASVGAVSVVSGIPTDCVLVNGTSATCGTGGTFQGVVTSANATGAITLTRTATVQTWNLTLTGNVSGITLVGFVAGDTGTLKFTQDSTPRVVTYGASVVNGSQPCSVNGSTITQDFFYSGSSMVIGKTGFTGCPPAIITSSGAVISIADTNGATLLDDSTTQDALRKRLGFGTTLTYPAIILDSPVSVSTPSAGQSYFYIDPVSSNMFQKNSTGTINHGIQDVSCITNQFVSAVSAAGAGTCTAIAGGGATFSSGNGPILEFYPLGMANGNFAPTAGRVYCHRISAQSTETLVTGISRTASALNGTTQYFAFGLYDLTGNLLRKGIETAASGLNVRRAVLTSPYTVSGGTDYYMCSAWDSTQTPINLYQSGTDANEYQSATPFYAVETASFASGMPATIDTTMFTKIVTSMWMAGSPF